MTRFKNYFDNSDGVPDGDTLERRLKKSEDLYDRYDNIQRLIESIVAETDQHTAHAEEREAFEDAFFNTITCIEKYISNIRSPKKSSATQSIHCQSKSLVGDTRTGPPLPTIVLPHFDGNYNQ